MNTEQDDLTTARGVLLGCALGVALWAAAFAAWLLM